MTTPLLPTRRRAMLASALLLAGTSVSSRTAHATTLGVDQRRADLAQFRRDFLDRDASYAPAARAGAQARLAALEAQTGLVDSARFALELARIAALADNGHTMSLPLPRAELFNRVPLRFVPFGRDVHVVRTTPEHAALLGATLEAIDGRPLDALRSAAHGLQGGPPAWRDRWLPLYVESPEQLHALGQADAPQRARYALRAPDGTRLERTLDAEPPRPDRPRANTGRLLLPGVLGEDLGWRGVLPATQAPWSLQEPLQFLRWRIDDARSLAVVEMRVTHDTARQKLPAFFDEARRAVAERRPRHLALDLRQNGGGDLTTTRAFAQSLPELVPGRLFVVTSPWTFSAAISTTGYVKQAAPDRVTLVGEEPGDRLEFWAEGRVLTLAHSRLALLPATERHDYRDGCRRFDDCHDPVRRHPIAVPTLAPDIAAPWTYAAWRDGIDPAMRAVEQALAG
ncbi:MAG: hypothetical protein JNN18_23370 [Rubrivivax sp.]|nr:hypothetical protein [Rubrivivax sp.]